MKSSRRLVGQTGRPSHREAGFTLVEMIVALFIVAVVMAIALPNLQAAGVRAAVTGCEGNQQMIRAALSEYYLDHHTYPDEATVAGDLADLKADGYLSTTPVCPSGGTYTITVSPDGSNVTVACSVHGELGDQ
ncbi:MAG: prepilin-type N-terminal cleavage/methylation domain-containing protein [Firmicutes bacterium]|nr:prepilin-type N-terminal cleavage/methylation domain-containing protein [Bacillota bacterium]